MTKIHFICYICIFIYYHFIIMIFINSFIK